MASKSIYNVFKNNMCKPYLVIQILIAETNPLCINPIESHCSRDKKYIKLYIACIEILSVFNFVYKHYDVKKRSTQALAHELFVMKKDLLSTE